MIAQMLEEEVLAAGNGAMARLGEFVTNLRRSRY